MNSIIEEIINYETLDNEEKKTLLKIVVNASHGINPTVAPGYYLRAEKINDEVKMALWYRNVDEDGALEHGSTNYNARLIVDFLIENCLRKGKSK